MLLVLLPPLPAGAFALTYLSSSVESHQAWLPTADRRCLCPCPTFAVSLTSYLVPCEEGLREQVNDVALKACQLCRDDRSSHVTRTSRPVRRGRSRNVIEQ